MGEERESGQGEGEGDRESRETGRSGVWQWNLEQEMKQIVCVRVVQGSVVVVVVSCNPSHAISSQDELSVRLL